MNACDFSIVEPLIDRNGKVYSEQSQYIKYLKTKGITEDLLSYEVTNVESLANDTYKVTTREVYSIHYGDGNKKDKTFKSIHRVIRNSNNEYKVIELIETTEL